MVDGFPAESPAAAAEWREGQIFCFKNSHFSL